MESINLGAVLFGLLLLLWSAYALPGVAGRREEMGRARADELAALSPQARDLSAAVHSRHARRSSREVTPPMPQDRLILRPADPTSRPRFDAEPGIRVDHLAERARFQRLLTATLVVLAIASVLTVVLALTQVIAWWVPVAALVVTGAFVIGLRRAELERRSRATRAATLERRERAEEITARRSADTAGAAEATPVIEHVPAEAPVQRAPLEQTAARAAQQVAAPGEWTPRPVPRPAYTLRGEVEDLGTRHAAHRQTMSVRTVPLEREGVEALEANDEQFAPARDLHLDEILARRRA